MIVYVPSVFAAARAKLAVLGVTQSARGEAPQYGLASRSYHFHHVFYCRVVSQTKLLV